MRYKSAAALEMAVKSAASASPMDTGRAVSAFYFHRLLCRVFAGGNGSFVLKGGRAMLARTVDARATRDIDLLSTEGSLEDALEELVRLAGTDLGDFVTFEFAGSHPIKAEDEYRSGLSVGFVPMLGAKRMQPVSVDLVVDEVPLEGAERISPADRIEVEGLETCDYLVYPVEAALADKLCGIVEVHVCFVKQIFRKSSSNSFGSQHESFSDFTKGCGTYPSFLFPSMSESVTRRLSPLNSTSLPWCTILSTSADASLSSANTVPHFPNSMLVVSTIDWRS